jgi:ABC-type multidrug transport system fused ATPase/permease subunit
MNSLPINLAELYHHGPENSMLYVFSFIGAFVILLRINSGLTLVAFAFLPFMLAYSLFFQKPLRSAYRRSREQIGNLSAQLEDSLAGIRVVKSFANEEIEEKKFRAVNEEFYRARADIYRREAYYFTGLEYFFTQIIMVAVVTCGAFWLSGAKLDAADSGSASASPGSSSRTRPSSSLTKPPAPWTTRAKGWSTRPSGNSRRTGPPSSLPTSFPRSSTPAAS